MLHRSGEAEMTLHTTNITTPVEHRHQVGDVVRSPLGDHLTIVDVVLGETGIPCYRMTHAEDWYGVNFRISGVDLNWTLVEPKPARTTTITLKQYGDDTRYVTTLRGALRNQLGHTLNRFDVAMDFGDDEPPVEFTINGGSE